MSLSTTQAVSTSGITLVRVGQSGYALRWDPQNQCWRWTDPLGGKLYAWPAPAAMPAVRLLESASVMACCASGRVLLGLGKRLGTVELPLPLPSQSSQPGLQGQSRQLQAQVLITIDAAEPRTSISDGCTDRSGNFVFGTANTAADRRPIGSFYQYSHRHGLRRLALPVVVTAASIAFSADGRRMYFADGARGAIMQCDYDAGRASVSGVEAFAEVVGQCAGAAIVDDLGHLWSAQGGALVQYDGNGQPRRQITLVGEAVTSVAFGGQGLQQLLMLGSRGGLYGLPSELADGLAPGVPDTPFDDSASIAAAATRRAQR